VVGRGLDEDRRPPGPIALVRDLLVRGALELAGALLDGAFDVVVGHVDGPRGVHRGPEPGVPRRVAAAGPGGHGDLADHLGPRRGALGVGRRLLVLDLLPLAVTGHHSAPVRPWRANLPAAR